MCLIINSPKGNKIPTDHLEKASAHNKDGFGISYINEKGNLVTLKTQIFEDFVKSVKRLEDFHLLIHMRASSAGDRGMNNVQPFDCGDEVFCHNGTIFDLTGHKTKSDSLILADILSGLPNNSARDTMLELVLKKDRAAIMNKKGEVKMFGYWEEVEGNFYSSDYWKDVSPDMWWLDEIEYDYTPSEDKFFVAVYGTLKEGYGNHRLLQGCKLVGKGNTIKKFPMVQGFGFPYAYYEEGVGHNIQVEVYEVSIDVLDRLDQLEGVDSGHYTPVSVDVDLGLNGVVQAEMYFACHSRDEQDELIENWEA